MEDDVTTYQVETKTHVEKVKELPFILRAVWFFVLGWELTGVWILIAWALNLTVLGLPLGLWMIDRVPQILTLKARPGMYVDDKSGHRYFVSANQPPFLLRALYFLVIGWWFSLVWAALGWLLCLTIIGLPIGVLMLNGLPTVTTLQKG